MRKQKTQDKQLEKKKENAIFYRQTEGWNCQFKKKKECTGSNLLLFLIYHAQLFK